MVTMRFVIAEFLWVLELKVTDREIELTRWDKIWLAAIVQKCEIALVISSYL